MDRRCFVLPALAVLLAAAPAAAQENPPADSAPVEQLPAAPPPPVAAPPGGQTAHEEGPAREGAPGEKPPPLAHTGFQIAARAGVAIPLGDVAKGTSQSDYFGAQFAAITDIGGKIIPELFIGAYLGGNVGAVGDSGSKQCDAVVASCMAVTYRIGVEAQYHFRPAERVDPWAGYGIGYEVSRFSGSSLLGQYSVTAVGPEYGHFMGGVDFRLTKIFGIGPFVDFSFGQYSHLTTDPGGVGGEIANKAMHQWLTIGAKFLFFP